MLGNLDNGVIFKKAFTDKLVFTTFVRDILGIEIEVDEIETEKKFDPKIGYVDFELDIFAQSRDKRVVIEIQRIEYDHHFDRFLHYFLMLIAEQQKNAKTYKIDQTVYVIVILTTPYSIKEKSGEPIKDEVLLLNLNPRTLEGKMRNLYGHKFVCLNPNHPDESTPQRIRDWLDLIYQSIHSPERPVLNTANEGIKKAMELINFDKLTPQERTSLKNAEEGKIAILKRDRQKDEEKIKRAIKQGLTDEMIAAIMLFDLEEVQHIRSLMEEG